MDTKVFLIGILTLTFGAFLVSFAAAAQNYSTINEFFGDIPNLSTELQSKEVIIPDSVGFLISNGNILASISMNDDSMKEFYFTVEDKKITGIFSGKPDKYKYIISTDEDTANEILKSENQLDSILSNYDKGNIKLKAVGVGNKFKLFFAKIFLKFK